MTRTPIPVDVAAFVGSRSDLSLVRVEHYQTLATTAAQQGWEIVTGAAVGCDQRAVEIACAHGGRVHLILPWRSYEAVWVTSLCQRFLGRVRITIYEPLKHIDWATSVPLYHPAAHKLRDGAIPLHARNFGIVQASAGVIALPSHVGGGTMQAIRIAKNCLRRPVFDLRYDGAAQRAHDWLTHKEAA